MLCKNIPLSFYHPEGGIPGMKPNQTLSGLVKVHWSLMGHLMGPYAGRVHWSLMGHLMGPYAGRGCIRQGRASH